MKKLLLVCALFLFAGISARAQSASTKFTDLPEDFRKNVFPQLVEDCKDVLAQAYMAQKKLATVWDVPGWEGFPVELYEYHTGVDIKKNVQKRGLVYLLMPSPEKLATWIATTCWEVKLYKLHKGLHKMAVSGPVCRCRSSI